MGKKIVYVKDLVIAIQGRSVWTKIIRNGVAVDYLFNGEAYDFNYQFENRLPKPVQLYPVRLVVIVCVHHSRLFTGR